MTIFDNHESPDEKPNDKKPLATNRFVLPSQPNSKIHKRVEQKELLIANLLAGGELYSDKNILSHLLKLGERQTQVTLARMVSKNLLVHEQLSSSVRIYGLTATGTAIVPNQTNGRALQIGKTVLNTVEHHILTQFTRLHFENIGAENWIPGKLLYQAKNNPLRNTPDALFLLNGRKSAIEIELNIKSEKRYVEIIGNYISDLNAGEAVLQKVYYRTPYPGTLNQIFDRLIPSKHRDQFGVKFLERKIAPYTPPAHQPKGEQNG